jgi:hypothetical protein
VARTPDDTFRLSIIERASAPGTVPYIYLLRGEDGSRRVWETWNTPTQLPGQWTHDLRVGSAAIVKWRQWRHDYVPYRAWLKAHDGQFVSRHRLVEVWRCDTCAAPVHEHAARGVEAALRWAEWGGWQRLEGDSTDGLVMRCHRCARQAGSESRKERHMTSAVPNNTPDRSITVHVVTVIALACAHIRAHGWVSEDDGRARGTPGTAELVARALLDPAGDGADVSEQDVDQANDAVRWLLRRRYEPDTRTPVYETRLAAQIWWALTEADGRVPVRRPNDQAQPAQADTNVAHIASAAVVYRDGLKKAARRTTWESLRNSRPIGKSGDRLGPISLTVTHATPMNKEFGGKPRTVHNYKLIDTEGNAYKWWHASKALLEGQEIQVTRCTVRNHEVYEGVTFTVIIRCNLEA